MPMEGLVGSIEKQITNILTKPLSEEMHSKLKIELGMINKG